MEFPTFIPVQEGQPCPATLYYVENRWDWYNSFQEELTTNWRDHIVTFGIYSIPVVGFLAKLVDAFFCALCLSAPDSLGDSSVSSEEKFQDVKGRIAELHVNDFIYFLAEVVQVLVFTALGVISSELVLTYVISDAFVLAIRMLGRFLINKKTTVDMIFREEYKTDLITLGDLRNLSNNYYTHPSPEKDQACKIFKRLHMIFYECVAQRAALAKKILKEEDGIKKIILNDPLRSAPGESVSAVQNWSLINSRLIEISSNN